MVTASRVGRLLPSAMRPVVRNQLVRYRHRGLRASDVVLVSYPKSGSTWLRFLLGHALTGTDQDFDSVREILPPIGLHRDAPSLLPGGGRLLRSHEPTVVLDPAPVRILYVARDGRDVATSYYHHMKREGRLTGDACHYLEQFLGGRLDGFGPWCDHVDGALERQARTPDEVVVVRYEDLRADTVTCLGDVLGRLGVAVSPSRIEAAVEGSSKSRMRAKEADSTFLRSKPSDGSPVVRPDGAPGWPELFASCATRLDDALRPTLDRLGYPRQAHG